MQFGTTKPPWRNKSRAGTFVLVPNIVGTLTNVAISAGCGHHRRDFDAFQGPLPRLQTPKFLSCPDCDYLSALTAIAWRAVYLHFRSRHSGYSSPLSTGRNSCVEV